MSVCVVRRHFGSRGVFSGPRIALAWSPLFLLCMHGALLRLWYGAVTWARYRLERSSATLVSSSGVFVRGAEHWSVYMQDVLQAVYERTGQRCILVARGCLAFCNHRDPSWTYHHVLQRITARCEAPRFVVWKSLGKDLCPPRADMRAYEPGLRRQRQPQSLRGLNILARISILAWISILNEVSPPYAQSVCALHQPRDPVSCNSRREPAGPSRASIESSVSLVCTFENLPQKCVIIL